MLEIGKTYKEKAALQPAHPRVCLLIDTEPVEMASGWLKALLEDLGGVLCDLTQLPDILLVVIPGFTLDEAQFAAQPLFDLPGWSTLPCAESGDCYILDSVRFFDTLQEESAQILATILYPEVFLDDLPPYCVKVLEKEELVSEEQI